MSDSKLLQKIAQLGIVNGELVGEIQALNQQRKLLEHQFTSDLATLNQAVCNLPTLIDVLLLEIPPPPRITAAGTSQLLSRLSTQEKWQISTLGSAQSVIDSISRVEDSMQTSRDLASKNKLDAADQASRAALHNEQCLLVVTEAKNAHKHTQAQLEIAERDVARVQNDIRDNEQLSREMDQQARDHDKKVEDSKIMLYATCWIPVVNAITIPIALATQNENERLARSCRDTITRLQGEAQTHMTRRTDLEATAHSLGTALDDLKTASTDASKAAKQSAAQRDEARVTTERYSLLTTKLRDVLQALDHFDGEVNADRWLVLRVAALRSLRNMLLSLKRMELLEAKCLPVVEMMEQLPMLIKEDEDDKGGMAELEW